jgi:mRNA interferase MazF
MSLRRGDLITVAAKGPYTAKPRPALVVQATETLPYRDSVTVCLLTGDLIDAALFRVRIDPAAANGLKQTSDVMADKVLTVPRAVVSQKPFGRLSAPDSRAGRRGPAFLARPLIGV